ncbi:zinc carboxypeptidase, partial [bacterium]|nr:zinc carboxypeptidase [candidate division CSSED10-310 bacterium]
MKLRSLLPATCALLCTLQTAPPTLTHAGGRVIIDMTAPAARRAMSEQDLAGALDILDCNGITHRARILVETSLLPRLAAMDISFTISKDENAVNDILIDEQYLDYDEVTGLLATYASTHPSIARLSTLAVTAEGRSIRALKLTDNPDELEDEPRMLFAGLLGAREIMSVEIIMDMVNYLLNNYPSDPQVQEWINGTEIWLIPMLNPDGNEYCWTTDPFWVKNRRNNGDGTHGVNLNRNFPFMWGECFGSSASPSSSTYRGPEPASEPEIAGLMALASERPFTCALFYHSFNEMVLVPYGCRDIDVPDRSGLLRVGSEVAQNIQRESGTFGYDAGVWWEMLYGADGTALDWLYADHGTIAMAIQVNASSFHPPYSIRNQTVQRNRPGWQKVLSLHQECAVARIKVKDACTNMPLGAVLTIDEIPMENGEQARCSSPPYGRYTWPLGSGTYHLRATREGYGARMKPIIMGTEPQEVICALVSTGDHALFYQLHQINDQMGDNDYLLDPGETAFVPIAVTA